MTFGKPRYDNKWIIYKQLSTNGCGGYFLKNSLRILIVHVFALDHLRGEDNKTKNFLKNFGLEFNCAHERIIPTLDFESLYCNIFFGHQV